MGSTFLTGPMIAGGLLLLMPAPAAVGVTGGVKVVGGGFQIVERFLDHLTDGLEEAWVLGRGRKQAAGAEAARSVRSQRLSAARADGDCHF